MKIIKLFISVFIIFFFSYSFFSQNIKIDYYGVVASSLDSNMSKMTSDLYYTQLCEISSFSVNDKRITPSVSELPDTTLFDTSVISFFTEINKNEKEDIWNVTIHVYNKAAETEFTKTKKYDSFYKILVESKQNLQETIKNLIDNSTDKNIQEETDEIDFNKPIVAISSEVLSGNWAGEPFVDKVVIMRGGRGFVIFKNGASMNINIQINESEILIQQVGKTNASFFPEMTRENALNAALTGESISWTLKSQDSNTLTGIKNTVVYKNGNYEKGTINVEWKRQN